MPGKERKNYTEEFMQHQNTGSFKEADNRTSEENKIIQLAKQLQQLKMENDILKQAALILGQK